MGAPVGAISRESPHAMHRGAGGSACGEPACARRVPAPRRGRGRGWSDLRRSTRCHGSPAISACRDQPSAHPGGAGSPPRAGRRSRQRGGSRLCRLPSPRRDPTRRSGPFLVPGRVRARDWGEPVAARGRGDAAVLARRALAWTGGPAPDAHGLRSRVPSRFCGHGAGWRPRVAGGGDGGQGAATGVEAPRPIRSERMRCSLAGGRGRARRPRAARGQRPIACRVVARRVPGSPRRLPGRPRT